MKQLFGLIVFFALLIPLFSPHDPLAIHFEWKNLPPGKEFWLGTDELGRDLFTRMWLGARISLFIGFSAALIDSIIGVFWGAIAALSGGKIEQGLMRTIDVIATVPYLLIVVFLAALFGTGIKTILFAMCCTGWVSTARIVRAEVLKVKESDYVLASRSFGASSFHLLRRHIFPNIINVIIATMTMTIPLAIFTEAFLSFLGLGIAAPTASLGVMIYEGLGSLRYYPWRLLCPAILLSVMILSLQFLGNRMRDAFDPRTLK